MNPVNWIDPDEKDPLTAFLLIAGSYYLLTNPDIANAPSLCYELYEQSPARLQSRRDNCNKSLISKIRTAKIIFCRGCKKPLRLIFALRSLHLLRKFVQDKHILRHSRRPHIKRFDSILFIRFFLGHKTSQSRVLKMGAGVFSG